MIFKDKKGDVMSVVSKEHVRELFKKQKEYEGNLALSDYLPKHIICYYKNALKKVNEEIEKIGVAL